MPLRMSPKVTYGGTPTQWQSHTLQAGPRAGQTVYKNATTGELVMQVGPTATCPAPIFEEQACNTAPCGVDCVVGEWGGWSVCSAVCGGGWRNRTRAVVVPAAYGGQACPVVVAAEECGTQPCPTDCVVGAWGAWGAGGRDARRRAHQRRSRPGLVGGARSRRHRTRWQNVQTTSVRADRVGGRACRLTGNTKVQSSK